MKKILMLFLTMLKIGAFTFGGGYAMISLLENEFVSKKQWLTHEEFMDLLAIAESTPGPIAINSSTYIGYKVGGFFGAFFATLGMCIPSFTIIFIISLFFDKFLSLSIVAAAFKGIQAGVIFLILSAGIKMLKKLPKTPFNVIMSILVFGCMTLLSLFAVNFSSIFYILICACLGLIIYCIGYIRSKHKANVPCKDTINKINETVGAEQTTSEGQDIDAINDCTALNESDSQVQSDKKADDCSQTKPSERDKTESEKIQECPDEQKESDI
ncbi:MAG: chromate transporter [Christensenellales bacterium]